MFAAEKDGHSVVISQCEKKTLGGFGMDFLNGKKVVGGVAAHSDGGDRLHSGVSEQFCGAKRCVADSPRSFLSGRKVLRRGRLISLSRVGRDR